MAKFPNPNHALARQFNEAVLPDYRHPAWSRDSITSSTGNESMRISTVRQLSRTLGTVLAETTRDATEAKSVVHEIQGYNPKVDAHPTLLNMTVGAIFDAPNFRAATPAVVRAWRELAQTNNIETPLLLLGLIAVTRDSCTEMLQDLLAKPAVGNTNETMDGSIKTVFGIKGEVSEIKVSVLNGAFCRALIEALSAAEVRYENLKKEFSAGKAVAVPEVAQVALTVDNSLRYPDLLRLFNVPSADFIQAYIAATFEYAAGEYADRVRNGSA